VTTPDPRDRALDGLLRRQLSDAAEASDACLDAETLAAWMDGGLNAHAQALVEAHAAGCARCQALMAAIVKSEPAPATAAAEPWWNRWSWRWLVPLTAAAAATLVWMIVPGDERRDAPPEQELTQARAASPAPTVPAETPASPPAVPEEAPLAAPSTSALGKTAPGPAPSSGAAKPSPAAPEAAGRLADAPTALAEARQEQAKQVGADTPSVLNETVRVEQRSAKAAPQAQTPAAQAPGASVGGVAAGAREAYADSAVAGGITSRDPAVRWRLAGPGVVERSTDQGASWARLETGVAAMFTAGSAPSASVCWLVGPRGLVLVTTDARMAARGQSLYGRSRRGGRDRRPHRHRAHGGWARVPHHRRRCEMGGDTLVRATSPADPAAAGSAPQAVSTPCRPR
jgi:hypothetical protein